MFKKVMFWFMYLFVSALILTIGLGLINGTDAEFFAGLSMVFSPFVYPMYLLMERVNA